MNLQAVNDVLLNLVEQVDDDIDLNDLGPFGMDAMSRRRLRVKRLHVKKKKKVERPMKNRMPYSLRNVPALGHREK